MVLCCEKAIFNFWDLGEKSKVSPNFNVFFGPRLAGAAEKLGSCHDESSIFLTKHLIKRAEPKRL